VVVLYHPDEKVQDNILSYLPSLDFLVVVDNSPLVQPALKNFLESSDKIRYFGGGVNRGIATALNIGAEEALKHECRWLLTMDQDSRFGEGALEILLEYSRNQTGAGILSPRHVLEGRPVEKVSSESVTEVSYVMTSGNLVNLEAYRAVGPFLDKLFIDYVDCEYCLRLRKSGYAIRIVQAAMLHHTYGEIVPQRFLGFNFYPTHHSPTRKYYITRNRLYVLKNFPLYIFEDAKPWAIELLKFLLFEHQRPLKLRFMLRGLRDFLTNRYGPLSTGP
jgi:rhamnosyltransferase